MCLSVLCRTFVVCLTIALIPRRLRTFVTDWRKEQKEKDESLRLELNSQRTALIEDGKPTTRLVEILKAIFTCYCDKETTARSDTDGALGYMAASRLWYQCGMKLSSLDAIEEKPSPSLLVSFKDFLGLIEKVVVEDDTDQKGSPATDQAVGVLCEVSNQCVCFNRRRCGGGGAETR